MRGRIGIILNAVALAALAVGVCEATAQSPAGPISIDLVSAIRYPTDPVWSPDGGRVAFLWDAAGKQDLYVATPGQPPIPVTDFPVDPNTLESDISRFAWATSDRLLFGKDGELWSAELGPTSRSGGSSERSVARRFSRLTPPSPS